MQGRHFITLGMRTVLVLAAAASLAGCDVVVSSMNASGKAQDEWTRSYPIGPNGRVELDNTNGLVEVLATDSPEVQVRAERIARANTDDAAKQLLKQVQIKENVTPGLIRLETVLPSGTGFGNRGEVRYYLKVPAHVSVRLHNTNGQIRVDGIKGAVRVETTNGGVRGRDLSGPIEASTTNGGVDLEVNALADGGIRATTTNGGVSLTIPENAKARLKATCVHGGVNVSGLTVEGENGQKLVDGKVNGGGPAISLETTNGGIRIRAGSSAK